MISAIWAEDEQGVIGVDGRLPWSLPGELAHFKKTTFHQAILMGRKTFEGMNKRVLPGRTTIIMTRDADYKVEDNDNVLVFNHREAVIDWYRAQDKITAKDLYIIGGAEIFSAFDGCFDRLYRTVVHGNFEGDTHFPENIQLGQFSELSSVDYPSDEDNDYAFTVKVYEYKR
ncbi:dihydrofolate reductase [Lactococcus insecticola]|uniref:Dihydrofolate reductase n=1 Tax=Pseudolactococcus insecticola TaxID=2709158 RepID=A0A6A0B3Z4_9LACT|nr:dihydrofolate reductase [Lactococcus insecticola]GFH40069.1 dihydrofolate reductase [Lactococcus insecticola]